MEKYEDSIRMATTERLVEMLKEINKYRRGEPPFDEVGVEMPYSSTLVGEVIDEAARRLEMQQPIRYERFNDEQFSV